MRPLRLALGFVFAVSAASYLTALIRVVLGFAFSTDTPYMGLWNDIGQFPLLFAVLEWPITAIVFAISIVLASPLKDRPRQWLWTIVCAVSFVGMALGIVAIRSPDPWDAMLPISLFNAYSQGWSDSSEPLFKLALALAFGVGGIAAAFIFNRLARQSR